MLDGGGRKGASDDGKIDVKIRRGRTLTKISNGMGNDMDGRHSGARKVLIWDML
jgi:hypothetical protein